MCVFSHLYYKQVNKLRTAGQSSKNAAGLGSIMDLQLGGSASYEETTVSTFTPHLATHNPVKGDEHHGIDQTTICAPGLDSNSKQELATGNEMSRFCLYLYMHFCAVTLL